MRNSHQIKKPICKLKKLNQHNLFLSIGMKAMSTFCSGSNCEHNLEILILTKSEFENAILKYPSSEKSKFENHNLDNHFEHIFDFSRTKDI